MVTDHIEIETFKEPYLSPQGEPLKIIIPDMRRQFRIETRPQEGAKVGTTVKVFVDGKKIPTDDQNKPVKPLDVTAYLSIVAGFVEFPIIVTEEERKTIVLHPKQDAENARQRFGEEFEVHQLDLSYPWSKAILPQDLPAAREVLREERYDIAADLDLEGYDGVLTYLVPIDDGIDLDLGVGEGTKVLIRGQAEHVIKQIHMYPGFSRRGVVRMSRSSSHPPTYAVYRDGILVPRASPPFRRYYREGVLPLPRLVVNLPKSRASGVNLARTQLLRQPEHWCSPVLQAHLHYLSETLLKDMLALAPAERLYQLGRLIAFHKIKAKNLWEVFPHERWPLPFLEVGGRLNVLEWQEVAADAIYLSPGLLAKELIEMVRCQWLIPT